MFVGRGSLWVFLASASLWMTTRSEVDRDEPMRVGRLAFFKEAPMWTVLDDTIKPIQSRTLD